MTIVKSHVDNFVWRLIVVYGLPYDEFKLEFIEELNHVMGTWLGPTVVGMILTWLGVKVRRVMV
jgi:hypothetical protein